MAAEPIEYDYVSIMHPILPSHESSIGCSLVNSDQFPPTETLAAFDTVLPDESVDGIHATGNTLASATLSEQTHSQLEWPGPDPTRYGDWEKGGRCIDF